MSDLTLNTVIMSLRKSDMPVSRVKHFSKFFELFVRKRSIHDDLLKLLKHVGFFIYNNKKNSCFFLLRHSLK